MRCTSGEVQSAAAFDHDDVVTEIRLDKRRKYRFVHGGRLESKRNILEWALRHRELKVSGQSRA